MEDFLRESLRPVLPRAGTHADSPSLRLPESVDKPWLPSTRAPTDRPGTAQSTPPSAPIAAAETPAPDPVPTAGYCALCGRILLLRILLRILRLLPLLRILLLILRIRLLLCWVALGRRCGGYCWLNAAADTAIPKQSAMSALFFIHCLNSSRSLCWTTLAIQRIPSFKAKAELNSLSPASRRSRDLVES